jgi:hypothetical protein
MRTSYTIFCFTTILAACGGGGGDPVTSTGSVADAVAATDAQGALAAPRKQADPFISHESPVTAPSSKMHADPFISHESPEGQ